MYVLISNFLITNPNCLSHSLDINLMLKATNKHLLMCCYCFVIVVLNINIDQRFDSDFIISV